MTVLDVKTKLNQGFNPPEGDKFDQSNPFQKSEQVVPVYEVDSGSNGLIDKLIPQNVLDLFKGTIWSQASNEEISASENPFFTKTKKSLLEQKVINLCKLYKLDEQMGRSNYVKLLSTFVMMNNVYKLEGFPQNLLDQPDKIFLTIVNYLEIDTADKFVKETLSKLEAIKGNESNSLFVEEVVDLLDALVPKLASLGHSEKNKDVRGFYIKSKEAFVDDYIAQQKAKALATGEYFIVDNSPDSPDEISASDSDYSDKDILLKPLWQDRTEKIAAFQKEWDEKFGNVNRLLKTTVPEKEEYVKQKLLAYYYGQVGQLGYDKDDAKRYSKGVDQAWSLYEKQSVPQIKEIVDYVVSNVDESNTWNRYQEKILSIKKAVSLEELVLKEQEVQKWMQEDAGFKKLHLSIEYLKLRLQLDSIKDNANNADFGWVPILGYTATSATKYVGDELFDINHSTTISEIEDKILETTNQLKILASMMDYEGFTFGVGMFMISLPIIYFCGWAAGSVVGSLELTGFSAFIVNGFVFSHLHMGANAGLFGVYPKNATEYRNQLISDYAIVGAGEIAGLLRGNPAKAVQIVENVSKQETAVAAYLDLVKKSPLGLTAEGKQITSFLEAKQIALSKAWEAAISKQPYKLALGIESAKQDLSVLGATFGGMEVAHGLLGQLGVMPEKSNPLQNFVTLVLLHYSNKSQSGRGNEFMDALKADVESILFNRGIDINVAKDWIQKNAPALPLIATGLIAFEPGTLLLPIAGGIRWWPGGKGKGGKVASKGGKSDPKVDNSAPTEVIDAEVGLNDKQLTIIEKLFYFKKFRDGNEEYFIDRAADLDQIYLKTRLNEKDLINIASELDGVSVWEVLIIESVLSESRYLKLVQYLNSVKENPQENNILGPKLKGYANYLRLSEGEQSVFRKITEKYNIDPELSFKIIPQDSVEKLSYKDSCTYLSKIHSESKELYKDLLLGRVPELKINVDALWSKFPDAVKFRDIGEGDILSGLEFYFKNIKKLENPHSLYQFIKDKGLDILYMINEVNRHVPAEVYIDILLDADDSSRMVLISQMTPAEKTRILVELFTEVKGLTNELEQGLSDLKRYHYYGWKDGDLFNEISGNIKLILELHPEFFKSESTAAFMSKLSSVAEKYGFKVAILSDDSQVIIYKTSKATPVVSKLREMYGAPKTDETPMEAAAINADNNISIEANLFLVKDWINRMPEIVAAKIMRLVNKISQENNIPVNDLLLKLPIEKPTTREELLSVLKGLYKYAFVKKVFDTIDIPFHKDLSKFQVFVGDKSVSIGAGENGAGAVKGEGFLSAFMTSRGLSEKANEDGVTVSPENNAAFVVDGVGGNFGGKAATSFVQERVPYFLSKGMSLKEALLATQADLSKGYGRTYEVDGIQKYIEVPDSAGAAFAGMQVVKIENGLVTLDIAWVGDAGVRVVDDSGNLIFNSVSKVDSNHHNSLAEKMFAENYYDNPIEALTDLLTIPTDLMGYINKTGISDMRYFQILNNYKVPKGFAHFMAKHGEALSQMPVDTIRGPIMEIFANVFPAKNVITDVLYCKPYVGDKNYEMVVSHTQLEVPVGSKVFLDSDGISENIASGNLTEKLKAVGSKKLTSVLYDIMSEVELNQSLAKTTEYEADVGLPWKIDLEAKIDHSTGMIIYFPK